MELPAAVYYQCPICKKETLHRVIKGKIREKKVVVLEGLFKCSKCGHKHMGDIRSENTKTIPVIVSEEARSQKNKIELSSEEIIEIGNEFELDRGTIKITAIEIESGRVEESKVKDIRCLWAKKFDMLKLKISVNKGSKTLTRTLWAVPEEEFFIGDVMRIKGLNLTIHAIKTKSGRIKRGSVQAKDIIRLYAKAIR
jgi:uncharacterized Zn finger protein